MAKRTPLQMLTPALGHAFSHRMAGEGQCASGGVENAGVGRLLKYPRSPMGACGSSRRATSGADGRPRVHGRLRVLQCRGSLGSWTRGRLGPGASCTCGSNWTPLYPLSPPTRGHPTRGRPKHAQKIPKEGGLPILAPEVAQDMRSPNTWEKNVNEMSPWNPQSPFTQGRPIPAVA